MAQNQQLPPFEQLFELYHGPVKYFFLKQGYEPDASEDLAQETFLSAYRGKAHFRGEASPKTWLFKIARNVMKNEIRDRKAIKRDCPVVSIDDKREEGPPVEVVDTQNPDPQLRTISVERRHKIQEALEKLPNQMRRCMVYRLRGFKYREIAELLGISIETVKSHLHQARERLKDELGGFFDSDEEEAPS